MEIYSMSLWSLLDIIMKLLMMFSTGHVGKMTTSSYIICLKQSMTLYGAVAGLLKREGLSIFQFNFFKVYHFYS